MPEYNQLVLNVLRLTNLWRHQLLCSYLKCGKLSV